MPVAIFRALCSSGDVLLNGVARGLLFVGRIGNPSRLGRTDYQSVLQKHNSSLTTALTDESWLALEGKMSQREATYRAGIIGLGFIGAADQVSGDALGQRVCDLDGTHLAALSGHPRIELIAGSSRDEARRERFA